MNIFNEWAQSFSDFLGRFDDLFGRSEPRTQMQKYVRGLLSTLKRKNGWYLAEDAGDMVPDRSQRLLYHAKWEADEATARLRDYSVENLGDPDGVGILDETGFIKKGDDSVGVKRQYSGTAGRTENCQVGTFLAYATPKGHVLLDRRLYLPADWCDDKDRRAKAQVPEDVEFQTKPQQGLAMLQSAWNAGVPMRWVVGDSVYGESPALRQGIHQTGRWYVLGVSSTTPVWLTRPALVVPPWSGVGRPPAQPRVPESAPKWVSAAEAIATVPASHWHRLSVTEGEKGLITYDWARLRVVERVDGLPRRTLWVLARRSISDPSEIKYYFSNAPTSKSLPALVRVISKRYAVEQCFEEAKGETGLDEYEVRLWHSWYRHITLVMMAHAWLTVQRAEYADWHPDAIPESCRQKGGPGSVGPFNPARSGALIRDRFIATCTHA